jgi:hypothetical protein
MDGACYYRRAEKSIFPDNANRTPGRFDIPHYSGILNAINTGISLFQGGDNHRSKNIYGAPRWRDPPCSNVSVKSNSGYCP